MNEQNESVSEVKKPRKKISFAHGQELSPDDAPALPLWVDGHAYLLMADRFYDLRSPSGEPLRRVPLYGADAVSIVLASSERGAALWRSVDAAAQSAMFNAVAESLGRYANHFAKLLIEETGMTDETARAEIAAAQAALSDRGDASVGGTDAVVAVLASADAPLAVPLARALEALQAGAVVVLKPSPKAPSALFACAELFARAGMVPGALNVLHGDEEAIRALVSAESPSARVAAVVFTGEGVLAEKVGDIVRSTGVPYVSGASDRNSRDGWQQALKDLA